MKKYVDAFLRRVDAEKLPVEAVAAWQGGTLRAERHFAPDRPRNIYSHTKSYLSAAVGLAISDGLLSLDDRPADFFPEALPDNPAEALHAVTLRHLLTMSSGFDAPLLTTADRRGGAVSDYVRHVLSHPVKKAPGTKFFYSNGDSYLAGRMVEKRVGRTLRDYLQERLFLPMDIPYPEWEHCPAGHTFGASGMRLRLADMAKLGLLFLQGGVWRGRALVAPEWICLATQKHIDTPAGAVNPWHRGYGFQFWRSPYPDSYRADGLYGQITTVLPRADAVVAIQCAESERFAEVQRALDETVLARL